MVSSPLRDGGHFNFKKTKSLEGGMFFHYMWDKSMRWYSDNGNQRGGHNLGQNNYHIIAFCFSRKSNFYRHIQRKNSFHFYTISFKREDVRAS